MKRLASLLAVFLLSAPTRALLLNEVMSNPAGSEYTDEFIELVQPDSLGQDLSGWRLSDGSAEDELLAWQGGTLWLAPGALALVLDSGYQGAYADRIPAGTLLLTVPDGALGSGGLSNSEAEAICLIAPDGRVVDRVWTRPELEEGRSLERRTAVAQCDSCWLASEDVGGTPGSLNSVRQRDWDLALTGLAPVCRVTACGRLGFRGNIRLRRGWPPCQLEDQHGPFDLAPGQSLILPSPSLPLAGLNPLEVTALPDIGEMRVLADTLLWVDMPPGSLFLEAVQPAGEDWIQLAARGSCPVLLDGLVLESRSFARDLSGWLPAGGRLLVGPLEARCPVALADPRSLTLALAGWARLSDPQGQVVDEAIWPENAEEAAPWRRLDPALPGDQLANWVPQPGLEPGCPPDYPDAGEPRAGGWIVSSGILNLAADDPIRLIVTAPAGVRNWRQELWSLDGRELMRKETTAERLYWDGRLADGRDCPLGVFILRLAGGGREQIQPLAIVRKGQ